MKRIMSTSALTILLASGATAQETTQSGEIFANVPNDPSMVLGTEYIGQNIYSTMSNAGMPAGQSATTGQATTEQATGAMATTEEPTTGEVGAVEQETAVTQQPQSVGQISDVIMTQDGQVEYVILGVGGFLGIGEQNVAVDFDALSMQPDPQNEGEYMIMISATQEQIENAPEFDPALIEGTAEGMQGGQTGTVTTESNAEVETTQSGGEMETIEADSSNTVEVENSAENAAAETEQAVEGAANETEQAVEGAANEAEQAAENAGESVSNAADEAASEAGEAVEQTGDAIEDATDEATSAN